MGAIVGGAIAGYFALRAGDKAHSRQSQLQEENRKKHVQAVLQAIHDEVETLWDSYHANMGVQLEALQEGWALLIYYPVLHDYFTVYTANAYLIGHITDPDLRRMIVQVYSKARGLIDSYRFNNDLVAKVEHWQLMLQAEPTSENYQLNWNAYLQQAQAYTKKLRAGHEQLKIIISQLLRTLRQMGAISKPVVAGN